MSSRHKAILWQVGNYLNAGNSIFYNLLDLLCAQQDWLRIKGIFNTDQGWKVFNFNPDQFNYKSGEEGIDNRIEIISEHNHDWLAFETALLACQLEE